MVKREVDDKERNNKVKKGEEENRNKKRWIKRTGKE